MYWVRTLVRVLARRGLIALGFITKLVGRCQRASFSEFGINVIYVNRATGWYRGTT